VRTQAQELVIEMYRWIGNPMKKQIECLRSSQVAGLLTAFEAIPQDKPQPLKRLRSQLEVDDSSQSTTEQGIHTSTHFFNF
jgi:cytoskeleton-associated protein 5